MFLDAGVEPPVAAVECSSVLAIHGLLSEGDWLTLLSPEQVSREVASGRLTILGPPVTAGASMIGVTTRAGWRPSGTQASFLKSLEALARARGAAAPAT